MCHVRAARKKNKAARARARVYKRMCTQLYSILVCKKAHAPGAVQRSIMCAAHNETIYYMWRTCAVLRKEIYKLARARR